MMTVFLPAPPCLSSANHRIRVTGNTGWKSVTLVGPTVLFSLNQNVCCILGYCFF